MISNELKQKFSDLTGLAWPEEDAEGYDVWLQRCQDEFRNAAATRIARLFAERNNALMVTNHPDLADPDELVEERARLGHLEEQLGELREIAQHLGIPDAIKDTLGDYEPKRRPRL